MSKQYTSRMLGAIGEQFGRDYETAARYYMGVNIMVPYGTEKIDLIIRAIELSIGKFDASRASIKTALRQFIMYASQQIIGELDDTKEKGRPPKGFDGESWKAFKAKESLDQTIGDDGEGNEQTGHDVTPDNRTPISELEEIDRNQTIARILGNLTIPRAKEVLELRFGLADGVEHTLRDVGRMLNISGERVRQIEEEGLAELKKSAALLEL